MSANRHIQERIQRLEALRRYQAYYGPNTPYQIVAEINQLEGELRRMLQADLTRPTQTINPAIHQPPKAKPPASVPGKEKKTKQFLFWHMSEATVDLIATIAFIGFVFLLGSIVFAAYVQASSKRDGEGQAILAVQAPPTLRPTFTPTSDPNNPSSEPVDDTVSVVAVEDSLLPAAVKPATEVPTPVPTLTPSALPTSTDTPTPTTTPIPTKPPPLPPTPTPEPPTPTPAPSFPFTIAETGNRMFQKTNYHGITIYIAITTLDNVPIGGLKVVGDHIPSGEHKESALSDWNWSASNCLDCDYIKFGNLKFEPGTFSDGVWNIYVADGQGIPLSPTASFSYASDPEQWVWDFIIFRKTTF